MLATLMIAGSSGAVTQTRVRAQRARDPAGDDRLLLAVLVGAQQLLAEVVVDRRVGRAARRAGQRDRRGPLALAAHQQLRRGGDERGVAAAGAEHEAGAERGAQHAEDGGGVVRRRRVDGDLAREHDLLEVARADALDGAGDGRLVVLRRRDRLDVEAPGGRGVEQRQRRRRAARRRAPRGARPPGRDRRRARRRRPASARPTPPRRAIATSGTTRSPAAKPCQCGAAPPSGANAKPPTATSPAPAGPSGVARLGVRGQLAPRRRGVGEAPRAARADRAHAAQRGQRGAVAVGLLEAEPRLARAARGEHDRAGVGRARRPGR